MEYPDYNYECRDCANPCKDYMGLCSQCAQDSALFNSVPHSLNDATALAQVKPSTIVDTLVLADSPTIVSATPHAMKSISWLAACMDAVAHGSVWGHFAAPNVKSTLFIETEDPQWLVAERVSQFGKGMSRTELGGFEFVCPGPFDLGNDKMYDELEAFIRRKKPSFWVLSTLQACMGGRDWKEQKEVAPIMENMVKLARVAPGVLITHSPWDASQRRAAGSVTITANFPVALHMRKLKTNVEAVVSIDSKLLADNSEFNLRLLTDGPEVRKFIVPPAGKGAAVRAVKLADPGASVRDISKQLGIPRSTVQDYLADEMPSLAEFAP